MSATVAAEILSASSFYEGVREGLGLELEREIDATLASLSENPLLYPREFGPVRRALIGRFKQVIFYVVRADAVVVVEVRDARREPPDWEDRGYRKGDQ